jgi:hypothetical protein
LDLSGPRDDAQLGQALSRQAQDQGIELRGRWRQRGWAVAAAGQTKRPALSRRAAPDAEPVVNEQLDARASRVREQLAMMRMSSIHYLHDARQQPVGAGAHVHRPGGQPHGDDADHRSSLRIQAAHSTAALAARSR